MACWALRPFRSKSITTIALPPCAPSLNASNDPSAENVGIIAALGTPLLATSVPVSVSYRADCPPAPRGPTPNEADDETYSFPSGVKPVNDEAAAAGAGGGLGRVSGVSAYVWPS